MALPDVTIEQMREVDRIMIEDLGITLLQMMEQAGRGLAELAISRFQPASCTVLAGGGGNGGGGLVAARHLANRGVDVHVTLVDDTPASTATHHQRHTLDRMGMRIEPVPHDAELIIDALLGYSLRDDPRRHAAELIRWAASSQAPVLSLDTPSGLALATLTIALPKVGLRLAPQVVGTLYASTSPCPLRCSRASASRSMRRSLQDRSFGCYRSESEADIRVDGLFGNEPVSRNQGVPR